MTEVYFAAGRVEDAEFPGTGTLCATQRDAFRCVLDAASRMIEPFSMNRAADRRRSGGGGSAGRGHDRHGATVRQISEAISSTADRPKDSEGAVC